MAMSDVRGLFLAWGGMVVLLVATLSATFLRAGRLSLAAGLGIAAV